MFEYNNASDSQWLYHIPAHTHKHTHTHTRTHTHTHTNTPAEKGEGNIKV